MGFHLELHCRWIGRFLVQTPLGAQPGLGTQPRYEVSDDVQVETWVNAVMNIGWVTLSAHFN